MDGADDLPIRDKANEIYDKVVNAIFGSLTQIAKTDRGDGQAAEDKGQLNYHVIMIGESDSEYPILHSVYRWIRNGKQADSTQKI